MDLDNCPHCGVSLRGDPIPAELLQRGGYGNATHWRRDIGVEERVYDGMLYWKCPDCGGTWHRFPEGHYLHTKAAPFIHGSDPNGLP